MNSPLRNRLSLVEERHMYVPTIWVNSPQNPVSINDPKGITLDEMKLNLFGDSLTTARRIDPRLWQDFISHAYLPRLP